jgi:hypothetical protein
MFLLYNNEIKNDIDDINQMIKEKYPDSKLSEGHEIIISYLLEKIHKIEHDIKNKEELQQRRDFLR